MRACQFASASRARSAKKGSNSKAENVALAQFLMRRIAEKAPASNRLEQVDADEDLLPIACWARRRSLASKKESAKFTKAS
jgi:hypothetical protein